MSLFDILKRLMNASDNMNEVMRHAAGGGHVEIVELSEEYGSTNFNQTMVYAALFGHVKIVELCEEWGQWILTCLLYTSPSPRDLSTSRMPSSA